MPENQVPQSVLQSNLSAIRSIADAVRGTFGPQGMDVMLIDQYGDFTITNDGVKVLSLIETSHPAAKLVIEAAKTQEELVGDGTTTVTLLVDALLSEATQQIEKGVPIPKLIDGIKQALGVALTELNRQTKPLEGLDDPRLGALASIAGRREDELVVLVMEAAKSIGLEKLRANEFKFAHKILAKSKAQNQLLRGIVVNKRPLNPTMPRELEQVKVLVIDDELAPQELPKEAIGTSEGFQEFQLSQQEFLGGLRKLAELDIKLVLVNGSIHPYAEEIFVQEGILAFQRVISSEIHQASSYSQAKPASRRILNLPKDEIVHHLGSLSKAIYRTDLELLSLEGETQSTLVIGAATEEAALEKERIASDIASAIQAALRGGVVSGGGALELGLIPSLEKLKLELNDSQSLTSFGIDCLIESLKKPLTQISSNLGFNALEKLSQVIAAQSAQGDLSLGIDADTGTIASMDKLGIYDAALVKSQALKTACEVAIQILKVNLVIRSRQID
ncbi:MAG: TCP-1/cpn60 chaperonin family protein [Candidatus Caenarcaniphilales bacterium]|nr:TCP-1/cpn60 chaperonin family protein [Candidatus Caenarcaniphilales bacterium]